MATITYKDIIAKLQKYNISVLPSHDIPEDRRAALNKSIKDVNAKLTIKEAGSWVSASRLVLTD